MRGPLAQRAMSPARSERHRLGIVARTRPRSACGEPSASLDRAALLTSCAHPSDRGIVAFVAEDHRVESALAHHLIVRRLGQRPCELVEPFRVDHGQVTGIRHTQRLTARASRQPARDDRAGARVGDEATRATRELALPRRVALRLGVRGWSSRPRVCRGRVTRPRRRSRAGGRSRRPSRRGA